MKFDLVKKKSTISPRGAALDLITVPRNWCVLKVLGSCDRISSNPFTSFLPIHLGHIIFSQIYSILLGNDDDGLWPAKVTWAQGYKPGWDAKTSDHCKQVSKCLLPVR